MVTYTVKTKPTYPIHLEDKNSKKLIASLPSLIHPGKIGIVSNSKIKKLYFSQIESALKSNGFEPIFFKMNEGEQYKQYAYAQPFFENLLKKGFERSSTLLALGGGVVGDFTGFLAANYLRGINFIQMPTSFLATVDASVGGKVAVNISGGKNMVGAFHQPKAVLINLSFLNSLPKREWRIGWAEVIKHALIGDRQLFKILYAERHRISSNPPDLVRLGIERSIKLKAEVVAKDAKEGGLRAILNFGHTMGHAIESFKNYRGVSHGEAVAMGMVGALQLSLDRGYITDSDFEQSCQLIHAAGLPLHGDIPPREIIKHMKYDKKKSQGKVHFVLLQKIGKASFGNAVTDAEASAAWLRGKQTQAQFARPK